MEGENMIAGEVKVGLIYKDELAERRMKSGDVYRIPAGSVFYMVNVGEGQRLQIICSIDKSESLSYGTFQVISHLVMMEWNTNLNFEMEI